MDHHRSVTVLDCLWQTRLQRRGTPLVDCVEHRLVCALEPSTPTVAVIANQLGPWVVMTKAFRRRDVLREGQLVGFSLTFQALLGRRTGPLPQLNPTRGRSAEGALQYPGILWRAALDGERPEGAVVLLEAGAELPMGRIVHVASMVPNIRVGMLFVDLQDVRRLVGGRWRVRRAVANQYPSWVILATGRRTHRMAAFDL